MTTTCTQPFNPSNLEEVLTSNPSKAAKLETIKCRRRNSISIGTRPIALRLLSPVLIILIAVGEQQWGRRRRQKIGVALRLAGNLSGVVFVGSRQGNSCFSWTRANVYLDIEEFTLHFITAWLKIAEA